MPAAAMTPAARALPRGEKGRVPLRIQPLIPAISSALIVRQENASTMMITNAPRDTLTFAAAEPVTVLEPPVRHLLIDRRNKKVKLCIDK